MIRRTLLTLALLVAPAMLVAQQPSAMQGQPPAADTSKAAATKGKHGGKHKASKKGAKPAAKPAADTGKMKPLLRGVVGVDADVVRRQVAGPYHRLRSTDSQVETEADGLLPENGARLLGVRMGGGAACGEGEPPVGAAVGAARLQGEAIGVERHAGGAGRGGSPA